ncbi:hypothetical protein MTR67_007188 [Solanum verrucosum]|uniref:Uncharacterized protein n=1 Tax=Solanum verrucosum TaxID=315347 RepID=A0AAF0PZR1_SOLVR|nr:hypothetical protein MTR67_007188 [Solanum verrucosum]
MVVGFRVRWKWSFSTGQDSSNSPSSKFNKDRLSNPRPQRSSGNGSSIPVCKKCGKSHLGKFLAGIGICFSCGKSDHKKRDYPLNDCNGKVDKQEQPSGSYFGSPC